MMRGDYKKTSRTVKKQLNIHAKSNKIRIIKFLSSVLTI